MTELKIHRADQDIDPRKHYKWLGGSVGVDGNIYCPACDTSAVLKVDTNTDHCSTYGFAGKTKNKWQVRQPFKLVGSISGCGPNSQEYSFCCYSIRVVSCPKRETAAYTASPLRALKSCGYQPIRTLSKAARTMKSSNSWAIFLSTRTSTRYAQLAFFCVNCKDMSD